MDRARLGLILIGIGVLAWPVGLFLLNLGTKITLLVHLSFVIPGALIRGSKIVRRIRRGK